MLKFTTGNAKVSKKTAIFSLPAGYSCPFAKDCLTCADRATGKMIKDGDKVRCYAASMEFGFPAVRKSRWGNFDQLIGKSFEEMVALIEEGILVDDMEVIRMGGSGDFFNQTYFDAWLEVAKRYPNKLFYTYTKSLPYWVARINEIPSNFKLTASKGGKRDDLIAKYNLVFAQIVETKEEADMLGLEIDHDDSLAMKAEKSFALLIHGQGKKGSIQAKSIRINGYSRKLKG